MEGREVQEEYLLPKCSLNNCMHNLSGDITVLKPETVSFPPPCLSIQAQTIAQAIGQAFGVAYQQFLQANGIKAGDLKPGEYSEYLESQELYNGDLAHFSDSQNIRDVSSVH